LILLRCYPKISPRAEKGHTLRRLRLFHSHPAAFFKNIIYFKSLKTVVNGSLSGKFSYSRTSPTGQRLSALIFHHKRKLSLEPR